MVDSSQAPVPPLVTHDISSADDDERLRIVGAHWADPALTRRARTGWLHSPTVLACVNARVTGREDLDWVHWFDREYLALGGRDVALSLGCNDGEFERALVAAGICHEIEGVDVSAGAIATAQMAADRDGLAARFAVGDVDTIRIPAERYDAIFVVAAMHHFTALERVLAEINRGLKPGGHVVLNEYIGATRFQWPAAQLRLATDVLRLLPARYRRLANGATKETVVAPSLAEMARIDPSEAIRSAEIAPLASEYLEVVTRRDYGGGILHLVLQEILHNFDETTEADCDMLRMLCGVEDILVREGQVENDFTVIVARKK